LSICSLNAAENAKSPDLMRLLQWSNGITTVWVTFSGHESDFLVDISLGEDKVTAPKLLKLFIAQDTVHYHDQEKKTHNL
jgi:hypothetical protein